MVDGSDFICDIDMYIYLPDKLIKYLTYVAYMPTLVGIFLFGIYLVIIFEVDTAVCCMLAYRLKMLDTYAHLV